MINCRAVCSQWRQIIDSSLELWKSHFEDFPNFLFQGRPSPETCGLAISLISGILDSSKRARKAVKTQHLKFRVPNFQFIDERIAITVRDYERASTKLKLLYGIPIPSLIFSFPHFSCISPQLSIFGEVISLFQILHGKSLSMPTDQSRFFNQSVNWTISRIHSKWS